MDFTCILSSLPGSQGKFLWLGTVSVTLLLYCMWSSGKPVGASSSGQGEGAVLTSVAAGDCACSCMLMPPPWSAEEAISASVAAVMLSVGSVVCFLHGHMLGVRGHDMLVLKILDFYYTAFYTAASFIGGFCTYLWSWNVWILAQGTSPYGFPLAVVLKWLIFIMGGIFCAEYGLEMFVFYMGGIFCNVYGLERLGFFCTGGIFCTKYGPGMFDFLCRGHFCFAEQSCKGLSFNRGHYFWMFLDSVWLLTLLRGVYNCNCNLTYLWLLSMCTGCQLEVMGVPWKKGFSCHWEGLLLPLTRISHVDLSLISSR